MWNELESAIVALHRAELRFRLWALLALREFLASMGYVRTPAQVLRTLGWLVLAVLGAVILRFVWFAA